MKLSSLKRSTFDEGVEKELPEFGVTVRVRSSNHLAYRAGVQEALAPHQRRLRAGGMIPVATNDRIIRRNVAKHLLLNWKGVEDDEGNPIEWSQAKALEMADDESYTEFFKAVERLGDDLALGQAEDRADLGNS